MAFPLHESKLPVLPLAMLVFISILSGSLHASDPPLTLDHYASTCPDVFEIVKKEMECEVLSDPRNAALILRLHFHDCFVQVHISLLLALSLIFFNSNILSPKWYPSQLIGYGPIIGAGVWWFSFARRHNHLARGKGSFNKHKLSERI